MRNCSLILSYIRRHAPYLSPFTYSSYYVTVCLVYTRRVDGVEINLCGFIRLVPHAFADNGYGDIHISCHTCP